MVDDDPLYLAPPSIEALQKENSYLRQEIHKVTSTLAIKAKDLAWWQNQFKSKSGVETKDIADSFLELIEYSENIVSSAIFANSLALSMSVPKSIIASSAPTIFSEYSIISALSFFKASVDGWYR